MVYLFNEGLIYIFIGFNNDLTGKRVFNFLQGNPTQNTLSGGFSNFTAFHKRGDIHAINCLAIMLRNDVILRHAAYPHRTLRS